jgi:hypothetical protein
MKNDKPVATQIPPTEVESPRRKALRYASAAVLAGALVSTLKPARSDAHSCSTTRCDWINVKDYGAVGNGTTVDTAAFVAAIAAAAGRSVTIPAGLYLVDSLTVPYGVTLEFEGGACLTPNGSVTITLDGLISAGEQQIFTGHFTFTQTAGVNRPAARAAWFGVKSMSNAGTWLDSGPQIQNAVDFCQSTRTTRLVLGSGYIGTDSTIKITASLDIVGQGTNETTIFGGGGITGGEPIFWFAGTSSAPLTDVLIGHMTLRDFYGHRLIGIKSSWLTSSKLEQLWLYQFYVGYAGADTSYSVWFENIDSYSNQYCIVLSAGCNDNHFHDSQLSGLTSGIEVNGDLDHLVVDACNFEGSSGPPIDFHHPTLLRDVSITNCRFEANAGPIGATAGGAVSSFTFRNNMVYNSGNVTGSFLVLRNFQNGIIDGNYFGPAGINTTAIDIGAAQNSAILAQNNRCETHTFTTRPQGSFSGTPNSFAINNGPCVPTDSVVQTSPSVEYGTAVPASGRYQRGSIVWNLGAVSGGYAGWICTAAGSPGPWRAFGAIT